jgi:oxygen-independent coproporphyrinogen-3 oxidase
MKLLLQGHNDRYAVEQLQLALFPDEAMEPVEAPFTGDGAVSALHTGNIWLTATAKITLHGKTAFAQRRMRKEQEDVPSRRRLLQNAYYAAAVQLRRPPQWGSLSGVRPSKLTSKHLLEGGTAASADKLLKERYHVSPARRRICVESSLATVRAVELLSPEDVSVYVGIPFCPTRCSYCSFVSAGIGQAAPLLPQFVETLLEEIACVGELLKESGKTVRTLYFGGGTPTTLTAEQLDRLMGEIARHFDLSRLIEYTVEGGRPDTLNEEKLKVLTKHGCRRISINPQSMNDAILQTIGRHHTVAQTVDAYRMARPLFDYINMDLIAGLPGETRESFKDSLQQVLELAPENITVHTLAMKKGADLFFARLGLPEEETVGQMLADAEELLRAHGYSPYYLYRQKYMSGSFENIGWSKAGSDCLYNIYMMEEIHSILSVGGGGMTKINLPDGKLERFHNPKFPKQYMERIEDVKASKKAAFALLK